MIEPPPARKIGRCQCVIANVGQCNALTPGPDVPFCHGCEDRHPDYHEAVGVMPLPGVRS